MPSVKTRLERLERARTTDVRCVWLYAGWGRRRGTTDAGDGVYRVFVPDVPAALPRGLLAVLRHPDRDGAEVGVAMASWMLAQLALGPRPQALSGAARILVLVTAGGPGPPPAAAAAGAAPPAAAVGSPPAAERPPSPAAAPQWPEWLPR